MKKVFNVIHPKHLNFMDNVRNFNSALACASFIGNIQVIPGMGLYVLRFQDIQMVKMGLLFSNDFKPSFSW